MEFIKAYWPKLALAATGAATTIGLLQDKIDSSDAATIFAAIVAGFVALLINETVDQRRRREASAKLREQREETYRNVVTHLMQSFAGGPKQAEHEVRSSIAMWASKDFVEKYSNWRRAIDGLSGAGPVTVPESRKQQVQEALAGVCLAARADLAIEPNRTPTVKETATILFDDYRI